MRQGDGSRVATKAGRLTWLAFFIFLIWLGAALRFYRLDAQSLWNDEGNSARLSERSLALIIEGTASDIHPPLYYVLLHGWRELLGDREFGLRALSAFSGVTVIAGVVALGRRLWPRHPGRAGAAGLFAAMHPALVYYSQEARMYQLLVLWAVLATLLVWPWLHNPAARPGVSRLVAYLLVTAAGLYTHYFYPVVILLHLLVFAYALLRAVTPLTISTGSGNGSPVVISTGLSRATSQEAQRSGEISSARSSPGHSFRRRGDGALAPWLRPVAWWGVVLAALLLLYAPWLPIFLRQVAGRAGAPVAFAPFWREASAWLLFGPAAQLTGAAAVLLAGGLLLVALLLRWRGGRATSALALAAAGVLLPIIFMVVTQATRPAYFKFLLVAAPFACLLWGWGSWSGRSRLPQLVGMMLAVVVLGASAWALQQIYFSPALARDDYRAIAGRVAADQERQVGVILNAPNQWEVFTYYYAQDDAVYPLPRSQADADAVTPVTAELEAVVRRHDRLYVLYWGEAEQDPGGVVEGWLDANTFKAAEEWIGDVRLALYAAPSGRVGAAQHPASVRFGDHIVLDGFTIGDTTVRPGDILPLTLFWRTDAPIDQRYKVFLHLVDGQGSLVAQRDAEPVAGRLPTTAWQPGQSVRDNHGVLLPATALPGRYTLLLGLYDASDPAVRLPLAAGQDTHPLAVINVTP